MTESGIEGSDLFLSDGFVDRSVLAPDAAEVLDACVEWLTDVDRAVFLPIDLLAVLLDRGHSDLEKVVAGSNRSEDDPVDQLRSLARRVERESDHPPRLHTDQFSLGFTGILNDALSWARESGRETIAESDLVRVMRWRAELQESASIRWALRQLAQPGGEFIFEPEGGLRRSAFSPQTWLTLLEGMQLSARSGLAFLGTPHYTAALAVSKGMLWDACQTAGVKPERLRDDLLAIVGDRSPSQPEFQLSRQTLTPRLVRMLIAAARLAEARTGRIREREILEIFLSDGGSSLELVAALGLVPHVRRSLDGPDSGRDDRISVLGGVRSLAQDESSSTLDQLGRDLTAEARAGELPEVLGRGQELQQIINVLMRSEQRNPLLTGKAGVGKTALANALAHRIAEGSVPERLVGMRVVEINGASLVGGTSYRGELEARIKALLHECEDDVILFIDEAHAVFAPRSSSGQPAEIPNHFKSALASGKIAVVAATTEAEYRRWIEDDPALRRRFERIHIEELSPELTREILVHLAPRFEREYGVPVTPDAIDGTIELSTRFIPEQSLPDKAKKLLMDATISVASDIALHRTRGTTQESSLGTPSKRVVTRLDVARQVALKTGAPLDRVARGSISWWVGLEDRLARHVIGQERAVAEIARHLVSSRLNNVGRRRPQAVLVLVGPPGVGKLAVARALADEVFGTREALLSLEMSDFSESHSISRLIGSPPGYVGYQDEDALVTPLRRRPSSVVLLQSFASAHPRVQDRLIRLFEEGEISDTRGLSADASHAIFLLTIDRELQRGGGIGFGRREEHDAGQVLHALEPELEERLRGHDVKVVVFDGLHDAGADLGEKLLASRMTQFKASLLDEYDIELVVPEARYDELLDTVRRLQDARDLERVFRERVVEPVTHLLMAGAVGPTMVLGEAALGVGDLIDEDLSDTIRRTPAESGIDEAVDGPRSEDPARPRPSGSSSGEWEPEPA